MSIHKAITNRKIIYKGQEFTDNQANRDLIKKYTGKPLVYSGMNNTPATPPPPPVPTTPPNPPPATPSGPPPVSPTAPITNRKIMYKGQEFTDNQANRDLIKKYTGKSLVYKSSPAPSTPTTPSGNTTTPPAASPPIPTNPPPPNSRSTAKPGDMIWYKGQRFTNNQDNRNLIKKYTGKPLVYVAPPKANTGMSNTTGSQPGATRLSGSVTLDEYRAEQEQQGLRPGPNNPDKPPGSRSKAEPGDMIYYKGRKYENNADNRKIIKERTGKPLVYVAPGHVTDFSFGSRGGKERTYLQGYRRKGGNRYETVDFVYGPIASTASVTNHDYAGWLNQVQLQEQLIKDIQAGTKPGDLNAAKNRLLFLANNARLARQLETQRDNSILKIDEDKLLQADVRSGLEGLFRTRSFSEYWDKLTEKEKADFTERREAILAGRGGRNMAVLNRHFGVADMDGTNKHSTWTKPLDPTGGGDDPYGFLRNSPGTKLEIPKYEQIDPYGFFTRANYDPNAVDARRNQYANPFKGPNWHKYYKTEGRILERRARLLTDWRHEIRELTANRFDKPENTTGLSNALFDEFIRRKRENELARHKLVDQIGGRRDVYLRMTLGNTESWMVKGQNQQLRAAVRGYESDQRQLVNEIIQSGIERGSVNRHTKAAVEGPPDTSMEYQGERFISEWRQKSLYRKRYEDENRPKIGKTVTQENFDFTLNRLAEEERQAYERTPQGLQDKWGKIQSLYNAAKNMQKYSPEWNEKIQEANALYTEYEYDSRPVLNSGNLRSEREWANNIREQLGLERVEAPLGLKAGTYWSKEHGRVITGRVMTHEEKLRWIASFASYGRTSASGVAARAGKNRLVDMLTKEYAEQHGLETRGATYQGSLIHKPVGSDEYISFINSSPLHKEAITEEEKQIKAAREKRRKRIGELGYHTMYNNAYDYDAAAGLDVESLSTEQKTNIRKVVGIRNILRNKFYEGYKTLGGYNAGQEHYDQVNAVETLHIAASALPDDILRKLGINRNVVNKIYEQSLQHTQDRTLQRGPPKWWSRKKRGKSKRSRQRSRNRRTRRYIRNQMSGGHISASQAHNKLQNAVRQGHISASGAAQTGISLGIYKAPAPAPRRTRQNPTSHTNHPDLFNTKWDQDSGKGLTPDKVQNILDRRGNNKSNQMTALTGMNPPGSSQSGSSPPASSAPGRTNMPPALSHLTGPGSMTNNDVAHSGFGGANKPPPRMIKYKGQEYTDNPDNRRLISSYTNKPLVYTGGPPSPSTPSASSVTALPPALSEHLKDKIRTAPKQPPSPVSTVQTYKDNRHTHAAGVPVFSNVIGNPTNPDRGKEPGYTPSVSNWVQETEKEIGRPLTQQERGNVRAAHETAWDKMIADNKAKPTPTFDHTEKYGTGVYADSLHNWVLQAEKSKGGRLTVAERAELDKSHYAAWQGQNNPVPYTPQWWANQSAKTDALRDQLKNNPGPGRQGPAHLGPGVQGPLLPGQGYVLLSQEENAEIRRQQRLSAPPVSKDSLVPPKLTPDQAEIQRQVNVSTNLPDNRGFLIMDAKGDYLKEPQAPEYKYLQRYNLGEKGVPSHVIGKPEPEIEREYIPIISDLDFSKNRSFILDREFKFQKTGNDWLDGLISGAQTQYDLYAGILGGVQGVVVDTYALAKAGDVLRQGGSLEDATRKMQAIGLNRAPSTEDLLWKAAFETPTKERENASRGEGRYGKGRMVDREKLNEQLESAGYDRNFWSAYAVGSAIPEVASWILPSTWITKGLKAGGQLIKTGVKPGARVSILSDRVTSANTPIVVPAKVNIPTVVRIFGKDVLHASRSGIGLGSPNISRISEQFGKHWHVSVDDNPYIKMRGKELGALYNEHVTDILYNPAIHSKFRQIRMGDNLDEANRRANELQQELRHLDLLYMKAGNVLSVERKLSDRLNKTLPPAMQKTVLDTLKKLQSGWRITAQPLGGGAAKSIFSKTGIQKIGDVTADFEFKTKDYDIKLKQTILGKTLKADTKKKAIQQVKQLVKKLNTEENIKAGYHARVSKNDPTKIEVKTPTETYEKAIEFPGTGGEEAVKKGEISGDYAWEHAFGHKLKIATENIDNLKVQRAESLHRRNLVLAGTAQENRVGPFQPTAVKVWGDLAFFGYQMIEKTKKINPELAARMKASQEKINRLAPTEHTGGLTPKQLAETSERYRNYTDDELAEMGPALKSTKQKIHETLKTGLSPDDLSKKTVTYGGQQLFQPGKEQEAKFGKAGEDTILNNQAKVGPETIFGKQAKAGQDTIFGKQAKQGKAKPAPEPEAKSTPAPESDMPNWGEKINDEWEKTMAPPKHEPSAFEKKMDDYVEKLNKNKKLTDEEKDGLATAYFNKLEAEQAAKTEKFEAKVEKYGEKLDKDKTLSNEMKDGMVKDYAADLLKKKEFKDIPEDHPFVKDINEHDLLGKQIQEEMDYFDAPSMSPIHPDYEVLSPYVKTGMKIPGSGKKPPKAKSYPKGAVDKWLTHGPERPKYNVGEIDKYTWWHGNRKLTVEDMENSFRRFKKAEAAYSGSSLRKTDLTSETFLSQEPGVTYKYLVKGGEAAQEEALERGLPIWKGEGAVWEIKLDKKKLKQYEKAGIEAFTTQSVDYAEFFVGGRWWDEGLLHHRGVIKSTTIRPASDFWPWKIKPYSYEGVAPLRITGRSGYVDPKDLDNPNRFRTSSLIKTDYWAMPIITREDEALRTFHISSGMNPRGTRTVTKHTTPTGKSILPANWQRFESEAYLNPNDTYNNMGFFNFPHLAKLSTEDATKALLHYKSRTGMDFKNQIEFLEDRLALDNTASKLTKTQRERLGKMPMGQLKKELEYYEKDPNVHKDEINYIKAKLIADQKTAADTQGKSLDEAIKQTIDKLTPDEVKSLKETLEIEMEDLNAKQNAFLKSEDVISGKPTPGEKVSWVEHGEIKWGTKKEKEAAQAKIWAEHQKKSEPPFGKTDDDIVWATPEEAAEVNAKFDAKKLLEKAKKESSTGSTIGSPSGSVKLPDLGDLPGSTGIKLPDLGESPGTRSPGSAQEPFGSTHSPLEPKSPESPITPDDLLGSTRSPSESPTTPSGMSTISTSAKSPASPDVITPPGQSAYPTESPFSPGSPRNKYTPGSPFSPEGGSTGGSGSTTPRLPGGESPGGTPPTSPFSTGGDSPFSPGGGSPWSPGGGGSPGWGSPGGGSPGGGSPGGGSPGGGSPGGGSPGGGSPGGGSPGSPGSPGGGSPGIPPFIPSSPPGTPGPPWRPPGFLPFFDFIGTENKKVRDRKKPPRDFLGWTSEIYLDVNYRKRREITHGDRTIRKLRKKDFALVKKMHLNRSARSSGVGGLQRTVKSATKPPKKAKGIGRKRFRAGLFERWDGKKLPRKKERRILVGQFSPKVNRELFERWPGKKAKR